MTYDYSREAEMFEKAVLLTEDDIRELSWVADVLDEVQGGNGYLSHKDLRDLAGVIRSKLPKPEPQDTYTTGAIVFDKNNAVYTKHGEKWLLVKDECVLEVPFESILGPLAVGFRGYEVVE